MKEKKKKKRLLRLLAGVLIVSSLLMVLSAAGIYIWAANVIDVEEDEALFSVAGENTLTRFYYDGEGGEAVAALPGYRALEWQEESFSGSARSLRVDYGELPPYLPLAFVAIEDKRFFSHDGVDVLRTLKAAANHIFRFSDRFGGSTITQQLIKNIGGEKDISVKRKLKEVLRALALEKRHSKEEILEAYLNIVPLSSNCVGVGAASLAYFGKNASELTLAEAASLAAITRSPTALDPSRHPEAHTKRRNLVLGEMLEAGMITEAEYQAAIATPLSLSPAPWKSQRVASWYAETVLADVKQALIEKGYSASAAEALLSGGGLQIYTAMDIKAQKTLESVFATSPYLTKEGEGFAAAMTVLDVENGNLLAIVGNRGEKKGNRLLNYATDTLRAPGSVLKPVALYAPAIEKGLITEATVFDDVPKDFSKNTPWPHNAPAVYSGLVNTKAAVAQSKNTVAVELYRMLGAENIYHSLVYDAGISSIYRKAGGKTDLAAAPLALGQLTKGVSLREMTRAYLPLYEGEGHPDRSFLLVLDRNGEVLLKPEAEAKRVYRKTTASVMTHMLEGVVENGTAKDLTLPQIVDTAGKTGTSGNNRDRWFIGYTPYLLAGIWCGCEEGHSATLGEGHLKVWDEVMRRLHKERTEEGEKHFTMAKGLVACKVCRDSGHLLSDACHLDPRGERGVTVWLPADKVPKEACHRHVEVWYDEEKGGVLLPEQPLAESARRVALLDIPWRDFPKQVVISDAEYVYRPLGDALPSENQAEPFFAATVKEGRFVGISARSSKQFNSWAGVAPPPLPMGAAQ